MIYEFTCKSCLKKQDINIPTWDIHSKERHSLAVDKEKLTARLEEVRYCECGGELTRKPLQELGDPMFIEIDKHRYSPPKPLSRLS